MPKQWLRRAWFIPPVLIALLALLVAPNMKQPPRQTEGGERPAKVRVIKVPRLSISPRVMGYGTTTPARSWEAVAEVPGQVVWVSEQLENGNVVAKGTELLRIDPAGYRLALTQVETQLKALAVKQEGTRATRVLEQRNQALLAKEVERKRKLKQQGTVSVSLLEEAQRALLKGEALLQELDNSLAINGAEQEVLKVQRASAELDLRRTRLTAPFDVRITDLKVHQAGYANRGQLLFSADDIAAVEVEARFPIGKLRPLMAGGRPAEEKHASSPSPLARTPGALNLEASVRLRTATHVVEWQARVDRVAGTVDPQTQTIGVVVVVDKPYQKARPGQRPPLVRNTFVEVELRKRPKGKPLVIPASALHQGKVYLVKPDGTLEIRTVKPAFILAGVAAIAQGLEEGETLVVSQLDPAIPGMRLAPQQDNKTMKRLKMAATGKRERHP